MGAINAEVNRQVKSKLQYFLKMASNNTKKLLKYVTDVTAHPTRSCKFSKFFLWLGNFRLKSNLMYQIYFKFSEICNSVHILKD